MRDHQQARRLGVTTPATSSVTPMVAAIAPRCSVFLDLMTIPEDTHARRTGLTHMTLNLAVTVAFVVSFLLRD